MWRHNKSLKFNLALKATRIIDYFLQCTFKNKFIHSFFFQKFKNTFRIAESNKLYLSNSFWQSIENQTVNGFVFFSVFILLCLKQRILTTSIIILTFFTDVWITSFLLWDPKEPSVSNKVDYENTKRNVFF